MLTNLEIHMQKYEPQIDSPISNKSPNMQHREIDFFFPSMYTQLMYVSQCYAGADAR